MEIPMDDGKTVFEIPNHVVLFVRGASVGTLLKMYFDNGGMMILEKTKTGESPIFLTLEPRNYETQVSFMSFYILNNEREEGVNLLRKVLKKFQEGKFNSRGKLIKNN